ncbi:putative Oligosaccharide flippase family protein [Vibrio crassostreae]|nr:putative Oligosaccharide flippase family protein [Vibrio crassostreae]CAK3449031.1 putative Oligosaccharide flippase family protein [Vibrio crassostreae]
MKINKVNTFYLIKLVSSYTSQIASLLVVLFVSTEDYGKLAIIIALSQFIFILSSGFTNGAMINIGSHRFQKNGTYNDILCYRYIIAIAHFLLISALYVFFDDDISSLVGIDNILNLVLILALAYFIYEGGTQILYPTDSYRVQSYIELLTVVILLSLIVINVKTFSDYIYSYLFVALISCSLTISYFCKTYLTRFSFNMEEFKNVYKYSAWQLVSIFSIYILNSSYSYILLKFNYTQTDIGIFNFTMRLFLGMSGFFSLALIVIPKIMHNKEKRLPSRMINHLIIKSVLILSLIYLSANFVLHYIMAYLDKNEYLESLEYMLYLSPAFMFMAYSNIMNTVLSNTNAYRYAQFVIAAQAIILVVLSLLFLDALGINGLIFSYTGAYFFGMIISYVIYRNNMDKLELT